MPNIGSVLKQEIARLSRRELRGEMQATKKASTQYRHHIAMLRRQLGALERQVATLQRRVADGHRPQATATPEEGGPKLRFAASRLRAQRTRHGLTAGDYAKLLGVSEQTVYNWEHGTHRPGQDRLAVIAELRGLGKRALQARLEETPGNGSSSKPTVTKKRPAKKPTAKKRATKKSGAKKRATKKSVASNAVSKKRATKKSTAKKRAPARKSTGNAAPRRRNAAKSTRNASSGNARPGATAEEATPTAS
jgi:predicted transcriptional regulator